MGADGGIVITKLKDIRNNWPKIKEGLIKSFEYDKNRAISRNESWNVNSYSVALQKSKELPDSLGELSDVELVNLFDFTASCDCPCLLEGNIITASGDYVWDFMNTLSFCLRSNADGIYIETWT
jgi:hypothetical protein